MIREVLVLVIFSKTIKVGQKCVKFFFGILRWFEQKKRKKKHRSLARDLEITPKFC